MKYIAVLLAFACVQDSNSLECRICRDVEGLEDCTETVTCLPNEVCYTDEKIVGSQVLYESGCRSRAVCQASGRRSLSKRDDSALIACSRCCDINETITPLGKEHCNDRICGLRLTSGISGIHQCYECTGAKDLDECNTITTCQQDQVCSVEQTNDVNNFTRYTMGCSKTHPCIEVTRFRMEHEELYQGVIIGVGKRSGFKTCSVCCGGPLCNTGGCFPLVDKLRRLWKAGSLDVTTLTYVSQNNG